MLTNAELTLYGPNFFPKYKKIYATCKAYFDISGLWCCQSSSILLLIISETVYVIL